MLIYFKILSAIKWDIPIKLSEIYCYPHHGIKKIHQRLITYVNGFFDTLHNIIFSLSIHSDSAAIFLCAGGFQVIFLTANLRSHLHMNIKETA